MSCGHTCIFKWKKLKVQGHTNKGISCLDVFVSHTVKANLSLLGRLSHLVDHHVLPVYCHIFVKDCNLASY